MSMDAAVGQKHWDVIVIGTGMGGATVGYALAKAGKSVLFLEKGVSVPDEAARMKTDYAELQFDTPSMPKKRHRDILIQHGRYYETIRDVIRRRDFIPLIGCGMGGSSALYGMAFERFIPSDFTPRKNHPGATGASLPDAWPITYDELAPYYTQAEALYRVKGEVCALRGTSASPLPAAPRPMNAAIEAVRAHWQSLGLHPYRLPLASEFVADCDLCQGCQCTKRCKNDSRTICLEPAQSQYGAQLLGGCEVTRLEATADTVTRVHYRRNGEAFSIGAKTVILAAGALETPRLLLASASNLWPHGLANHSGLVGKYFMRHHIDVVLLKTRAVTTTLDNKDIGLNDFYFGEPKLGTIQSFGLLPPVEMMVAQTLEDIAHSPARLLLPLVKLLSPLLRWFFARIRARRLVLATITEDMPYVANAVTLPAVDEVGVHLQLHYRVSEYDEQRANQLRTQARRVLKPFAPTIIRQTHNNQRIAHGCGTCRFGNDPKTSVLDRNNKAHGLTNLYVVDASFFPSSGATNPSLTIAANALRVASHLVEKQKNQPYLAST